MMAASSHGYHRLLSIYCHAVSAVEHGDLLLLPPFDMWNALIDPIMDTAPKLLPNLRACA